MCLIPVTMEILNCAATHTVRLVYFKLKFFCGTVQDFSELEINGFQNIAVSHNVVSD